MSTRARSYDAQVLRRARVSDHLVRIVLGGPGLADFESTGLPDEWVGLVVPGQFQSRYYTVRSWEGGELTLDVVVHDVGLVTEWVQGDCVGETVTLTEPKGSFAPPEAAAWVILVGDLTAMPAMARISTSVAVPVHVWAEVPDDLSEYLPTYSTVHWLDAPHDGESRLASVVETIDWPEGDGYFWMAGESAQMRAIRKHLMRERRLPSTAYDVMGYWRGGTTRQPRAVDPGPLWRAGKAAGKNDDEIWADYDDKVRDG
ncbi:siderophore-interacting protein [Nocardioides szechwanensis]|uniref:NADPH-dependent ferric siderophore reductase, contains FAD-binding and SIP domains n=1 Tax=Nocardioides szechwanensis TaxID=1005944 RepID=A0A1H0I345_9ACTN|nr:siderophore-interacting protein [Nocardioides szechwanensis]GEP34377.1 siderophore-interacting protein [Nocardioides szechwanensis]SDO25877.1 NADPH-dependent ferric siderophore reductase, contains FAD-binding and SIP domains [Nocardioides szechwanensis]